MEEVAKHKAREDAWIVVDNQVYDITEHVVHHPGWEVGAAMQSLQDLLQSDRPSHSIFEGFQMRTTA